MAAENLEMHLMWANASRRKCPQTSRIQQALAMFSKSRDSSIVVIHEAKCIKDYMEPNYHQKSIWILERHKKNLNYISDIRLYANGKVSELELRRK